MLTQNHTPYLNSSATPVPCVLSTNQAEPHPSEFSSGRFSTATDEELAKLAEGLVPENTEKTTNWAMNNFKQWVSSRSLFDPVPDDFLMSTDIQTITKQLSRFIVETRKSNGGLYPPATLHQLLCGILRHMRKKNSDCPNFLDKADNRFKQLHSTLDAYFHKLHSEGIGTQTKHAEVISAEEEDQLWKESVMDIKTPTGLQNAAFFVVGKMFCLRGGQEHI